MKGSSNWIFGSSEIELKAAEIESVEIQDQIEIRRFKIRYFSFLRGYSDQRFEETVKDCMIHPFNSSSLSLSLPLFLSLPLTDDKLENMSKRQTDHASVLPLGRTFKLNVNYDQEPIYLRRQEFPSFTIHSFSLSTPSSSYSFLLIPSITIPSFFASVNREAGIEKQYRMRCKRCDLWVAYEPSESGSQFTFIVDGALTEQISTY